VETTLDGTGDESRPCDRWDLIDKSENPEQNYAREQRAYMLRAAVLRLKSGTRKVLELQQATDLSVKEIAQSLGISQSAAKSRLNRAKIELRASMKRKPECSRVRHLNYR